MNNFSTNPLFFKVAAPLLLLFFWACAPAGLKMKLDFLSSELNEVVIHDPKKADAESPDKPVDPYHAFMSAQLLGFLGQTDESFRYLEMALASDPESSVLELELARYYIDEDKPAEALKHTSQAIRKDPANREARLLAADIFNTMKLSEEAIAEYEAILLDNPTDKETLIDLMDMYAQLKQYEKAEKIGLRLLELLPESGLPMGYFQLGRMALSMDQLEKAEQYLRETLTRSPNSASAISDLLVSYGSSYEGREKPLEAEKVYKMAIRFNPVGFKTRLLLARLYLAEGKDAEAVKIFEAVKADSRGSAEITSWIGLIYFEHKDLNKAIKEFQAALKKNPADDKALYYLSLTYSKMDEPEKALEKLDKIKPESQFYIDSRILMSVALVELKQNEQAIGALQEAINQKPESVMLYDALAQVYDQNGQLDMARETIIEALDLSPDDIGLIYHLGIILDKLQDKDAGIEQMKRVVELDPEHADALNYLAYTWAEQGENLDEALKLAHQAAKLKPNNGYILDTVGWVYFKRGDLAAALNYLKQASALMPEDPTITEHYGDIYLKLENYPEAIKILERALHLNPDEHDRLDKKIKEAREKIR